MSLKSILKDRSVFSCERTTSIEDIVKIMKDKDVGAVVVVEHKKPVGIVTDRDLVLRGLTKGSKAFNCNAEYLMTSPIETVSEDEGIYAVIGHMQENAIRRICVVDDQGCCVNVISSGDILELLTREMGRLISATVPTKEKLMKERAA